MRLVTHIDASVRHLRAKTLVLALCDLAGCRRRPHSLALWWRQHHRVVDVQLNRKWDTFFHGVTPRQDLREQMYADFPILRALFDNPLWLALSDNSEHAPDWDQLAESIRVGNQPLGAYNSPASMLLFSRVDWSCLGGMVILLRTRTWQFALHRKWLTLNFGALCSLACLRGPLAAERLELYGLLRKQLSPARIDTTLYRKWPDDAEEFEFMLVWYRILLERIEARGWFDEIGVQSVLLLWMLLGQDDGLAVLENLDECRVFKWPIKVRRLWIRQNKLWHNKPITLGDYHFPAPF